MKYLPKIVKAQYLDDFVIRVKFDDGTVAAVDFARWLKGPVFHPLKKKAYFKRFFIEGGTVAWPNGADVAPETIYKASQSESSSGINKSSRTKVKKSA